MAILTVGSGKTYATIQLAIDACNVLGGDAIEVYSGGTGFTYTEEMDLRPGAGWLKPVTIKTGVPGQKITLANTGAAQAVNASSVLQGGASGKPIIEDFIFSGWTSAINGVIRSGPVGIGLRRCEWVGCTGRLCINQLFNDPLEDQFVDACLFITSGSSGTGGTGVINSDSFYSEITNNVIICPTNVQAIAGTANFIKHNSIYGTWNSGGNSKVIRSGAGSTGGVYGGIHANVIENAGTGGLYAIEAFDGPYTGRYSYNVVYGTFSSYFNGGTDDGGNITGTDPEFSDPVANDLTTPNTSPCYRAVARSADVLTTYDGASRSNPTDIGAYETLANTTVGSITVVSSTSIKLNLVDSVTSDATWEDEANFTITGSGGAAAVTVSLATITDAGMSITLTTTEHTNGGAYNVAWAGVTNIVDGNDAYTGTSTPPVVSSAAMTAGKTVRVTFSKSMTNNAALTTVGNYLVSGMVVSGVVRVDATRVDVTFTERIPAASATISVNGPQDLVLNPVSNSTANFAVPYLTFVPGVTQSADRRTLGATFNLAPTGGVSAVSDWTITRTGLKGAEVAVVGVTVNSTAATLTVHPPISHGITYVIAAPGAYNAQGIIG